MMANQDVQDHQENKDQLDEMVPQENLDNPETREKSVCQEAQVLKD
jgi:hypothetical protein